MQSAKEIALGMVGRVLTATAAVEAMCAGRWSGAVPLESVPLDVKRELSQQVAAIGRDPMYRMYTFDSCLRPGTQATGYRCYVVSGGVVYRLSIEAGVWCLNVCAVPEAQQTAVIYAPGGWQRHMFYPRAHHRGGFHAHGFRGLGQPPFELVSDAVYLEPSVAKAACTRGWGGVPSSWPQAITAQAVNINGQASSGDVNYVYYDGKIYEFTSGGNNTWISRTCSGVDKTKIPSIGPAPAPAPVPGPPGPPGPVTPVVFKTTDTTTTTNKSSVPWVPIAVIAAAAAAGIGAAVYFSREKKAPANVTRLMLLPRARRRGKARRRKPRSRRPFSVLP